MIQATSADRQHAPGDRSGRLLASAARAAGAAASTPRWWSSRGTLACRTGAGRTDRRPPACPAKTSSGAARLPRRTGAYADLGQLTGHGLRNVSSLPFICRIEMSIVLTSPVCGSILISLPRTDSVGRDVDARAAEHLAVDALAGAVGLRDRRQDDLQRRDAVERVARVRRLAVLRLVGVEQRRRRAAVPPASCDWSRPANVRYMPCASGSLPASPGSR